MSFFNSNITVSIVKESDKALLNSLGIKSFYSFNQIDLIREIGETDIIINTVPMTVICDKFIRYINPDAYVLDVASHPHGIDQEVLAEYFIKSKLYLGIPGKIAPKTSGKILSKKISKVMGD